MASDPQVERTHIQAECNVTAKELLQFVHETQRMDRHAAASSCLLSQELTFRANHVEDYRRERRFLGPLNLRRQGLQGLSDIARQLDIGGIAVVEVRRQDVDVDDLAQALAVPKRWPIFDRIIPYGNDKVSGFEQPIGRLVSELANPAAEIIKQHRAYGACRLEGADHRKVVLANEGLKCPGVGWLAGQHSQQHHRVRRGVDEARGLSDRSFVSRTEAGESGRRQRFVRARFGHDVLGQIDIRGAGPAGFGRAEGVGQYFAELIRSSNCRTELGHRLQDRDRVHRLMDLLQRFGGGNCAAERHDRVALGIGSG